MLCRQIEVAIMSLLNRVKAHNRQGMRPHFLTFCTKATFKGRGAVAFQKGAAALQQSRTKRKLHNNTVCCVPPSRQLHY